MVPVKEGRLLLENGIAVVVLRKSEMRELGRNSGGGLSMKQLLFCWKGVAPAAAVATTIERRMMLLSEVERSWLTSCGVEGNWCMFLWVNSVSAQSKYSA